MVYGLPAKANPWSMESININTPNDPHSAFTHLKNYPINGGLVDGPVYTSIYKSLIGIELHNEDEYADWQSNLAVYHDDYGDYSTNEPTMDGTASLIYLLAAKEAETKKIKPVKLNATFENKIKQQFFKGAIVRGDTAKKNIALVFTGHEFADGGISIANSLKNENIKASFFFTGDFYRNKNFTSTINILKKQGNYLGAHSNKHLLYASWQKQDSLLVTQKDFNEDIIDNYETMKTFGLNKKNSLYFLPPYEWYNDTIASWTNQQNLQLINYTIGTLSNADYTWPQLNNYRSSPVIYKSIMDKAKAPNGLNGFILLLHIGSNEKRTDKFYTYIPQLIKELRQLGYKFKRIDELLD
jgi:endoglucanase